MLAQLGSIKFDGLKGFSELARVRETLYAEIDQIGGKPDIQRVGEKLDKQTLSIRFHIEFCEPETEIKALNDLRVSGDAVSLLLGNGENYGNYVVSSISENLKKLGPTGNIIYADVEIGLIEFARATVNADLIKAQTDGFASDITKVVPQKLVTQSPGIPYQAAQSANLVFLKSDETDKNVAAAKLNETKRPNLLSKIGEATTEINAAANDVANKMRKVESEVDGADRIIKDAEDVARFASDLAVAVETADIDLVENANTTLQTASVALAFSNSKLLKRIGAREL